MKRTIAAILTALFLPLLFALAPLSQPATGCTVAGADVAASLASATTCLDIPAGVYSVGAGTGGAWLNAPQDGLEIRGAGEGLTVLRITSPLTLTSDLVVLRLFGVGQRVHDLTIDLGSGHSGAGSLAGIAVSGSGLTPRGERATIERVEVTGGYTPDGAKGYGIGTYRGYLDQGGAQWVTIRDCYIHDSPSTGIGINSNNNLILNNHIARVGTNWFTHGVYAQGGYNLYQGNTIENASGYSFHGHKQVPNLDSSGDRYIGNTSINPGTGHIVINGTTGSAGQLDRYATISGNVFKNTNGRRNGNVVWCNGVPCLISDNVLEDTFVTTGGGWIEDSGGSVITGNILSTTGVAPDGPINFAGIRISGGTGAIVSNNRVVILLGCCAAIRTASTASGVVITGNSVQSTGYVVGLVLDSPDTLITGNRINGALTIGPNATGAIMNGNRFK